MYETEIKLIKSSQMDFLWSKQWGNSREKNGEGGGMSYLHTFIALARKKLRREWIFITFSCYTIEYLQIGCLPVLIKKKIKKQLTV